MERDNLIEQAQALPLSKNIATAGRRTTLAESACSAIIAAGSRTRGGMLRRVLPERAVPLSRP